MSLGDLTVLYLIVGLACAVAIYRSAPAPGPRAAAAAALAVPLWPLWAPIALTGSQRPRPAAPQDRGAPPSPPSPVAAAAARIEAALREGVDACAGTSLESLLPRDAAGRIAAEVRRAADRHAELSALVGREGFDLAAAEARVGDLAAADASPRAVSTARLHLDNVRRLLAMRDRDALALEELADLVQALRAQLVLARFAGSQAEGAGGIVSEVWARVEGLGVALGVDEVSVSVAPAAASVEGGGVASVARAPHGVERHEASTKVSKHILVVDDEARIREVLLYALKKEGFAVTAVPDGHAAIAAVDQGGVDLVVLDVMLPELDGLEVCRRLRQKHRVPILFLSARGEEIDRIVGLEIGGDDYLSKPFSPRELVARVRAVFRRVEAPAPAAPPKRSLLQHGAIEIDTERHEVRCGGRLVALTPTEFGVLGALLERPGVVLSRGQLMQRAYRYDNLITERTIDTHVRRIRSKFRAAGGNPIATVHGVGYKASDL